MTHLESIGDKLHLWPSIDAQHSGVLAAGDEAMRLEHH